MNPPLLPSPQRKVVLRLAAGTEPLSPQSNLNADEVDNLFKHARALGLPLHHDDQVAALLVSLRMNKDVPTLLYIAAAAVLATIYAASAEN